MNQATNILKAMQEAREQALALTGFTEEELNELQWNAALDCLRKVLGSDEHGIDELPKNPDFWLWWRDQWFRRDDNFLNNLEWNMELNLYTCARVDVDARACMQDQAEVRTMYLHYHRIAADNPLVNNKIMEVSFHRMIKDIATHNHK